jgi:hypothetical protein
MKSSKPTVTLFAALAASTLLLAAGALAQSNPGAATAQSAPGGAASGTSAAPGKSSLAPLAGVPRSQRADRYYALRYGVDHLRVRSVSSGASLEFRYRVLDAAKAHILSDKRATPAMIDWKTGAKLVVPTMEQIGPLRQAMNLEPGREYWMVFSNPAKLVKPGDRVDVVVGSLRLEGLMVE